MKRYFILLLPLIVFLPHALSAQKQSNKKRSSQNRVVYKPDTTDFANPERGLCRLFSTKSSDYKPLDINELTKFRLDEGHTLVWRQWYLDAFLDAPISKDFLDIIATDLYVVREAGMKAIVRFAYVDSFPNDKPPFGDVPKHRILQHIAQLKTVLQQNSDVIALAQMGFIGIWGEGYFSDHFGVPDKGKYAPEQTRDRREVLDALLNVMPASRMVALRTPFNKANLFNIEYSDSLRRAYAYSGKPLARVAHHNDCFLAGSDDYGTYINIDPEKEYLAAETRYLVMGGETCEDAAKFTNCENALREISRFHWSYLNIAWKPEVYARWQREGCFDEIKKRLGYRFRLHEAKFDKVARAGRDFHFSITIENEGFAGLFNPRAMRLVWRKKGKDAPVFFSDVRLGQDIRPIMPGGGETRTLEFTVRAPEKRGSYELFLEMPAPPKEVKICGKPAYSIRLANLKMWDETTGWNKLNMEMKVLRGDKN